MAQDVYSGSSTGRPDFPAEEAVGNKFLPIKPESGAAQWTAVKAAWGKPEAATAASQVLASWRKAYRWEDSAKVTAQPPKFAIQSFEEVYMSAPLLCAASA